MTQQARNLLIDLDDRGQQPRLLIPDRDTKFSRAFGAVFHAAGMTVIRTPFPGTERERAHRALVGSARRECLDRLLIVSRRQLERVLHVYVRHYNEHRPHRALDLQAPDPTSPPAARGGPIGSTATVRRRDLLGGLIHEYQAAAA
jgi:hypothetical protein